MKNVYLFKIKRFEHKMYLIQQQNECVNRAILFYFSHKLCFRTSSFLSDTFKYNSASLPN